jgi:hypothetical protein
MDHTASASRAEQWLVQGEAVSSGAVTSHIAGDPNVTEVGRLAKDVVVLSMSPDRAALLGTQFVGCLVIERNRDLVPPS